MLKIERAGALALIVDSTKQENRTGPKGHVVIDRYRVDDQGNICLTPPGLSLTEMDGIIEVIKAELDALRVSAFTCPS